MITEVKGLRVFRTIVSESVAVAVSVKITSVRVEASGKTKDCVAPKKST